MSDIILPSETTGTSNNSSKNWVDLLKLIEPNFLRDNQELISSIIQLISENIGDTTDMINLREFGIADTEELNELAELVPRYNELIDTYEDLEESYETLQREYANSDQQLKQVKQRNLQLVGLLRNARMKIQHLESINQRLRYNQQRQQTQLQNKAYPGNADPNLAPGTNSII